MIERDCVLTLNHVEITEPILRCGYPARIVCLRVSIQGRLKVSERLIRVPLFQQCAALRKGGAGIRLRFGK